MYVISMLAGKALLVSMSPCSFPSANRFSSYRIEAQSHSDRKDVNGRSMTRKLGHYHEAASPGLPYASNKQLLQ